jgi:hypothetical protein
MISMGGRPGSGAGRTARLAPGTALRRHQAPIVASLLFLALGMAYFFGWGPLVLHRSQWTTGSDLWGVFRAAHYVGWGWFGGIYLPANGVVTFPGFLVIMAPVAMVSGALGLSESNAPYFALHPAAALLAQPVELLLSVPMIFAVDSVARSIRVSPRARWAVCVTAALVALPVLATWSHAEDVLSLALGLYALESLMSGRYRRGGWLLGAGIAIQPLIALAGPLLVGMSRADQRLRLILRALVPSVVLIGLALAGNFSDTVTALTEQPTSPVTNHPTPWTSLSPVVAVEKARTLVVPRIVEFGGHYLKVRTVIHLGGDYSVAGGAVRTISLVVALVIGVWVWRRRPDAVGLVWLFAAAIAARCYFEPVMTPYYLAPPLIVGVIAAGRAGRWRFLAAVVVSLADTAYAAQRFSLWVWWLPVMGMLTVVLACGFPGRAHLSAGGVSEAGVAADAFSGEPTGEPVEAPVSAPAGHA